MKLGLEVSFSLKGGQCACPSRITWVEEVNLELWTMGVNTQYKRRIIDTLKPWRRRGPYMRVADACQARGTRGLFILPGVAPHRVLTGEPQVWHSIHAIHSWQAAQTDQRGTCRTANGSYHGQVERRKILHITSRARF